MLSPEEARAVKLSVYTSFFVSRNVALVRRYDELYEPPAGTDRHISPLDTVAAGDDTQPLVRFTKLPLGMICGVAARAVWKKAYNKNTTFDFMLFLKAQFYTGSGPLKERSQSLYA